MNILSVETAHPPHYYNQAELLAAFQRLWQKEHHNIRRVEQLHRAVMVGGRHLALPMEEYETLENFTDCNNRFIEVGTDIAQKALQQSLDTNELHPRDIDAIFFVTVTGLSTPSIDAKLVNRLGLREDIKRIPIFGLGCVAGAAGLGRVYDYLKAYPDHIVALISVELCSLTLQQKDLSIANLIASGLFGDGCACVLAAGDSKVEQLKKEREERGSQISIGPKILGSRSRFYPNTEDVMGWDIGHEGFTIILQATVPKLAKEHIGPDLRTFLSPYKLNRDDISTWICHTGGPKVITAFQQSLGLQSEDVQLTLDSLREVGNLSSASVLYVLKDTLEKRTQVKESYGVLMAMGPGFCNEMVLLQF
jgi:alkylresorcinol/alkylpyrone synthase